MKLWLLLVAGSLANAAVASSEGHRQYLHLFNQQSVETPASLILVNPLGDQAPFSITLRDKESGLERGHDFQGQGANDPSPFQSGSMNYCDTMSILLTVDDPWQQARPQDRSVLETFAFRDSNFEFIDVAFGPLTDIALQDSS